MRGAAFPPSPQSLNSPTLLLGERWTSCPALIWGPAHTPFLVLKPLMVSGMLTIHSGLHFPSSQSSPSVSCDPPSTPMWEVRRMLGVTPILQGKEVRFRVMA